MKNFKEFLYESTFKISGFNIIDKTGKLNEKHYSAIESILELSMGYLKIKPVSIYVEKKSRAEANSNTLITIGFDKNIENMIKQIAHELTHISQYQRGDMNDDTGEVYDYDHILWKGKRMKMYNYGQAYMNSPWEIEAREKEQKIFDMWKKFNK